MSVLRSRLHNRTARGRRSRPAIKHDTPIIRRHNMASRDAKNAAEIDHPEWPTRCP
jgi:hypothetical protein